MTESTRGYATSCSTSVTTRPPGSSSSFVFGSSYNRYDDLSSSLFRRRRIRQFLFIRRFIFIHFGNFPGTHAKSESQCFFRRELNFGGRRGSENLTFWALFWVLACGEVSRTTFLRDLGFHLEEVPWETISIPLGMFFWGV